MCAGLVGAGKDVPGPADHARRDRHAEDAVATLRKAADGGHQSPAMLASDLDFEASRSRDDFQALVADLRASSRECATPTPS
jgi:hypothetical protein